MNSLDLVLYTNTYVLHATQLLIGVADRYESCVYRKEGNNEGHIRDSRTESQHSVDPFGLHNPPNQSADPDIKWQV